MGFSRQEYCSGLPFSSPGHLPNPGIEPWSPTLQADSLPSEPPEKLSVGQLLGFLNHSEGWSPNGKAIPGLRPVISGAACDCTSYVKVPLPLP